MEENKHILNGELKCMACGETATYYWTDGKPRCSLCYRAEFKTLDEWVMKKHTKRGQACLQT